MSRQYGFGGSLDGGGGGGVVVVGSVIAVAPVAPVAISCAERYWYS